MRRRLRCMPGIGQRGLVVDTGGDRHAECVPSAASTSGRMPGIECGFRLISGANGLPRRGVCSASIARLIRSHKGGIGRVHREREGDDVMGEDVRPMTRRPSNTRQGVTPRNEDSAGFQVGVTP
jgi:hypothetical protein